MNREQLAHHLLALRTYAMNMNEHSIINFWVKEYDTGTNFHVEQMHQSFKQMAEVLGYDVNLKDTSPATEESE